MSSICSPFGRCLSLKTKSRFNKKTNIVTQWMKPSVLYARPSLGVISVTNQPGVLHATSVSIVLYRGQNPRQTYSFLVFDPVYQNRLRWNIVREIIGARILPVFGIGVYYSDIIRLES